MGRRGTQVTERVGDLAIGRLGKRTTRRRFLCGALATMAAALGTAPTAAGSVKAGDRPRTVMLDDLTGARIALPDTYGGNVVVVHFWASWCPSCLREIDALESLFGEYRGRGFVPVSVNVGETKAVATEALRSRKVTYPILLDPDSAAARLYGVRGFPTTFVLNREGSIGLKVLGEIDHDGLRRILSGRL
jgi:cytochrome c biogenesis protein CcmG, thiol:disulfide interchange protein DsbE